MQPVVLSSPGTKQQRKPGGASSKEAYKRDVAGYLSSVKGTWQRDPSQRLDHSTIPGSDIFVRLGRLSRSNVRGGLCYPKSKFTIACTARHHVFTNKESHVRGQRQSGGPNLDPCLLVQRFFLPWKSWRVAVFLVARIQYSVQFALSRILQNIGFILGIVCYPDPAASQCPCETLCDVMPNGGMQ